MGASPQHRKKRKRTQRANAAFTGSRVKAESPRVSLPIFATLFALAMMGAGCARTLVKASSKKSAEERDARAQDLNAPWAVLFREQHEICPQAALFAHPVGRCLLASSADNTLERLGPFTCLADARFFLRTLGVARSQSSFLLVDVGSPPARGMNLPETMELEARIRAGEDELPGEVRLVLVDPHEDLSVQGWSTLLLSLVQVMAAGGAIIIRGRQAMGLDTNADEGPGGLHDGSSGGSVDLRKAVDALACSDSGVAAAVGNFDGGIVVVRHAAADERPEERGCRAGEGEGGEEGAAAQQPQLFEKLVLWATGEMGTVETVQANFGGADAVRNYARQRSGRAACLGKLINRDPSEVTIDLSQGDRPGRLRGKVDHSATPDDTSARASRVCLENHLRQYPRDVRAAFALAMAFQSARGKGVDSKVARLRDKVCAESGEAGASLWRALHARAALDAATGLFP